MSALVAALVAAVASVAGAALYVPQLVRLVRTGDVSGLPGISLLNGTVNYTAWTVYLAMTDAWLPLVANAVASAIWYVLVALAVRKVDLRKAWRPATCWTAVLAGAAFIDTNAFAAILSLGVVVTYAPMAWEAWRAPVISGLSAPTWWLCALEGASWFGLGVIGADAAITAYGVVATAASVVVLAALAVRREARTRVHAAPS